MSEEVIPKGYWQDASGALIPVGKIKDVDKERHQVVSQIAAKAKGVSDMLRAFKLEVMGEIENFIDLSATQYGATMRGAKGKGNVTMISFDGKYKVVRAIQESLAFDERLQVAKTIIDGCIHSWSKGSNKNIQALVNQAFQVDKQGKVNTGRVLGLRTLKIEDPDWQRAMDAISDSVKTVSSKSYVRIYERNDAGEYEAISLDVSGV